MKSTTKLTLFCSCRIRLLVAVTSFLLVVGVMAAAQTETVLYSFTGGGDGAYPIADLTFDAQGNLYSTTAAGGYGSHTCPNGCGGTVFAISSTGTKTTLHTFFGAPHDGLEPRGGLVRDGKGNLFGVTFAGGAFNAGTVFRVTSSGKEKVLYSFTGGADGSNPQAGLPYVKGNLYGTTSAGGANGTGGTVFQLAPDGTETTLYTFGSGADGAVPLGSLIQDAQGNFYGTTSQGGTFGFGTVFKLASTGSETVLYNFTGQGDGTNPASGLIRDSHGNLYGTTGAGGSSAASCVSGTCGTVFQITPNGLETVLYSFGGLPDASGPAAGLIRDLKGNFYGTTVYGGIPFNFPGSGTVFKLTPSGKETVLYKFTGGTDGAFPLDRLVMDQQGDLYGTVEQGGTSGFGAVFKLVP